jgi:hypothetical protein
MIPETLNHVTQGEMQRYENNYKALNHRYMQDTDITDGHSFSHKVEVDLDMLRAMAGGVEGVVWAAAEVMGAAWGAPKSVKQATKERCRSWWSDRPGWRSDGQPIYGG